MQQNINFGALRPRQYHHPLVSSVAVSTGTTLASLFINQPSYIDVVAIFHEFMLAIHNYTTVCVKKQITRRIAYHGRCLQIDRDLKKAKAWWAFFEIQYCSTKITSRSIHIIITKNPSIIEFHLCA